MLIKKLKEILPLLSSCLVVLVVGIVCFSLTKTDAALISDNITPPPDEELREAAVEKRLADDNAYIISGPEENFTTTTGAFTYTAPVFVADANVDLEGVFLNDVFVAGNNITIRGQVAGDVFAAGSNIVIMADVAGDVFAAGANVTITGSIAGDVRLAGSKLKIDNHVGGNVQVFGETVTITKQAHIERELMLMAGTVLMSGHVTNNIMGQARELKIYGIVDQNVMLDNVDTLLLDKAASVGGNVEYSAPHSSAISSNLVGGEITYHPLTPDQPQKPREQRFWSGWFVVKLIVEFIGYLILGLVCLRLMSKRMLLVSQRMRTQPLASFGWGLLYFILLPLVLIILAITLIGLPLSGVILLVALLVLVLAKLYVGVALGQWLLPKARSVYGQFILGFTLFYLPLQLLSHGGLLLHALSTLICAMALSWSTGAMLKQWKQHHE